MALSDGDYGGAFGPFDNSFDPALAMAMQNNPEALIPHLAAAGVPPPGPQFAENFAPRFDAAFPPAITGDTGAPSPAPLIPNSGVIGDQSIYAQPPGTPGGPATQPIDPATGLAKPPTPPAGPPGIWDRIMSGANKSFEAGEKARTSPAPRATPTPSKPQDRVEPSGPGRVPPTALGKSEPPTTAPTAKAEEPDTSKDDRIDPDTGKSYSPGYKTATVAGTSGGDDTTTATPASDPRKATAGTDSAAVAALGKAVSGLSGVRAPPAPPQPQLRPYAGERPNPMPQHDALVSLLSQAISGGAQGAQALRLLQAVGGK